VFLFRFLRAESSMLFLLLMFCLKKNKSVSNFKEGEECAERLTPAGSLSVSVVILSAAFSDCKWVVFCNWNDFFYGNSMKSKRLEGFDPKSYMCISWCAENN
jgi:hypothetical protein